MQEIKSKWLGKLRKLNPNVIKAKGAGNAKFAPHKPLLLLCLLDLAEVGDMPEPLVQKSPELRLRFDSYWGIVQPRWGGRPGLDLPFHYLSSQGFWVPLREDGNKSGEESTTVRIRLDEEFFGCLRDSEFRRAARFELLKAWFPDEEQQGLLAALGISKAESRKQEFVWRSRVPEVENKGRDARFRITVVTQYRFTCALTSYGLHTRTGSTIVEAAHIHSFSKSRNDSPENGLALTRDAHWMFDEGLWMVDEGRRIQVATEVFAEWGPEANWLKARHGAGLSFMEGVVLRPAEEHLAWHRANVFAG
jgi:putative restriction endonuclease